MLRRRKIEEILEPDEELELDVDAYLEDGTDNQLDRAVEIIEEKLK